MTDGTGWDWDAVTYDRLADPQTRWGQTVLGWLRLSGGETVLDAGCGTGRVTELLLSRLPRGRVIALDVSPAMLELARGRLAGDGDRVRFIEADLVELAPAMLGGDAPVDAVFSTATFHWITDHDRLFGNLASVLRPGGQLVAQCGARGNVKTVIAAARAAGADRIGTWQFASPAETRRRLARAGFTGVRVWAHPEPTPLPAGAPLAEFLETICLHEYAGTLPPERRRAFAQQVAAALPAPVIDYVRLNIVARRSPAAEPGQRAHREPPTNQARIPTQRATPADPDPATRAP